MTYADYQKKLNATVKILLPKGGLVLPDEPDFLIEEIGNTFNLTMGEIGWLCEMVRQVITKERKPEDFEAGLKEKLDEDNQPKTAHIVWEVGDKVLSKLLPALGISWIQPPKPAPLPSAETPVSAPEKTPVLQAPLAGADKVAFEDGAAQPASKPPAPPTPPRVVPIKRIVPPPPNLPTGGPSAVTSYNPPAGGQVPPLRPEASEGQASPVHVMPPPPSKFITENLKRETNVPPSQLADLRTFKPATAPKPPLVDVGRERLSENPLDSLMKMLQGKVNERELQSHFAKLPESLRVALESVNSAKKVVEIGQKHGLHVDKLGDLGAETGMVILGFTHPGQFLARLTRRLGMSEAAVRPIAQEINNDVFLKIREALKQINGEGGIRITAADLQPTTNNRQPATSAGTATESKPAPKQPQEEMLDRDDILRGIENPTPTYSTGATNSPQPKEKVPIPPFLKEVAESARTEDLKSLPLADSGTPFNKGRMGEGTKNVSPSPLVKGVPESARVGVVEDNPPAEDGSAPFVKGDKNLLPEIPPVLVPQIIPQPTQQPKPAPAPAVNIGVSPELSKPSNLKPETSPPPLPEDIIGRKLSGTTVSAKSEQHYTADPYREPLG